MHERNYFMMSNLPYLKYSEPYPTHSKYNHVSTTIGAVHIRVLEECDYELTVKALTILEMIISVEY